MPPFMLTLQPPMLPNRPQMLTFESARMSTSVLRCQRALPVLNTGRAFDAVFYLSLYSRTAFEIRRERTPSKGPQWAKRLLSAAVRTGIRRWLENSSQNEMKAMVGEVGCVHQLVPRRSMNVRAKSTPDTIAENRLSRKRSPAGADLSSP
jgi:hypothetical protein